MNKSNDEQTWQQIDMLACHLEDAGIRDVTLLEVLEELPDLEYGTGDRSLDVTVVCQKCDEEIDDHELMGTAFESFYHDACVPGLSEGPLPLHQFLTELQTGQQVVR